MQFRLDAKHYFFTYPRCHIDKQQAYDFLFAKFDPELLLVAREVHSDGTPHLHAYMGLHKRKHFRNPNFADLVFPPEIFHGNYQSCRSSKAVQRYATKGSDFIANFDPEKTSNKKLRRWAAEQIVQNKRPLVDLVQEEPELIHGYNRLKLDINAYIRDLEASLLPSLPPFLPNPWGLVLPSLKLSKRRHYWLWSSQPNVGKTHFFAEPLAKEYGAALVSGNFTYWPITGAEKCVILDEYNTALLKYSDLDGMCDGHFGYRVFHGGVVKLVKPLIIVLSNQCISTMYPHMNHLLYARFIEKKLD